MVSSYADIFTDTNSLEDNMDKSFKDFYYACYTETAFAKFKNTIKQTFFNGMKKLQDTIKSLKRELFGYNKTDGYGNKKHVFGANELRDMFMEASPSTLREIANEIEEHNCSNFAELSSKKPNVFRKFFSKAKNIFHKIEQDNGISY